MIWLLGGYMWLFIHRPFEIWPWLGDLHIERVYMLGILVAWVMSDKNRWQGYRLNAAFGLQFLAIVMSCVASAYPNGSVVVENYAKLALVYILLVSCIHTEEDCKRVSGFFLVAIALYASHSLIEYFHGRHVYRMGTLRMVGVDATSGDPNSFAATLVYAMPMSLPFWNTSRSRKEKVLLLAFIGLCEWCIILTGSRTSLLGSCVFLVGVILTRPYRWRAILLLIIAAPIVWSAMPADRQNRYLTLFDSSRGPRNAQESAEGRRQGWRDGVELWRQNPLFGVGPGAFGEARESELRGLQAHNLYGQVIGELGSLGALSLACILGSVLLNWRDARQLVRIMPHLRQSFAYHVILASAATFGLLLLQGLTSHNIYRYTWLWMGAFQTVALACLKKEFSQEAIGAADDENAEYEPATIACLGA